MAEQKLLLKDWLDDLCVRFILNLPEDDLSSVARICFQVEEAQWFYEDFIRPLDPTLPSMSLRSFCLRIFQHCPLLASFSVENHMRAFEEFLTYKTRIPVRGAILLNEAMDSTILVKGWKKGANWSFPRGKINKDEDDLVCAIREVYEETGFDLKEAGLIPQGEDVKYIQISIGHQQIRLYVFRDVPMDTVFEPRTRKEISKIQWYKLSELPAFRKKGNHQDDYAVIATSANKFYMVAPFLVPLKKWVIAQKQKDAAKSGHLSAGLNEEALTEDDIGNQTETPAEVPTAFQSMGTQEAELELRRLLRLQPPPQFTHVKTRQEDHAQALLEILQSASSKKTQNNGENLHERAPITLATHSPRTPLEMTDSQPPEPRTPHHQHPASRLGAFANMPPPPFPLAPQALPNRQHSTSTSSYGGLNHATSHSAYATAQTSATRQGTEMLHPQPLPAQVQSYRFTRELGQTPTLSEAISKMPAQPGQHLMSSMSGMRGDRTTDNRPQQQATYAASIITRSTPVTGASRATPQLSTQQMSLLNALKGQTSSNQNPATNAVPLVTDMSTGRSFPGATTTQQSFQAAGPSLQPAVTETTPNRLFLLSLLDAGNKDTSAVEPSAGTTAARTTRAGTATAGVFPSNGLPRPLAANSSHTADLLDLFRKPATPKMGADSMTNPAKPADMVPFTCGPGIENAIPKPPGASDILLGSQSKVNYNLVSPNNALNMPEQSFGFPTRSNPEEGTSQHASPPSAPGNANPSLIYPGAGHRNQNGVPVSQGYPVLLRRGQAHGDKSHGVQQLSQLTAPPSQQAGTQPNGNHASNTFPSARGSVQEPRRVPDQRQEQQWKLLSLLKTKSPTAPTASTKDSGTSRPQVSHLPLSEHKQNGDTGSKSGSRWGSQTPNPAGHNFLLNYLKSNSGASNN